MAPIDDDFPRGGWGGTLGHRSLYVSLEEMMQLNSAKALTLGREVHETFGSWKKAREAAVQRGGVYVIDRAKISAAKAKKLAATS